MQIYELIASFGEYEDYISCNTYIESSLSQKDFKKIVEEIKASKKYKNIPIEEVYKRLQFVKEKVLIRDDCFIVGINTLFIN